jgi:hypothetical protein
MVWLYRLPIPMGRRRVLYSFKCFLSVPAPVPVPDPNLFSTVFQQQKCVQNLAFSMLDAAMFPRKLASNFLFLTFVFRFMLDPEQALFLCTVEHINLILKLLRYQLYLVSFLPRKSSAKAAQSIKPWTN